MNGMGSRLRRALQRVFRVVGPRARPRCRLADDRAGGGRPRRARRLRGARRIHRSAMPAA